MVGQVWQWTLDNWHESYAGAPIDGSAWQGEGSLRVLRGGSFRDRDAGDLRADDRHFDVTGTRRDSIGFRLTRSIP